MTIRSKLILLYSGLLAIIIVVFGIVLFAVARWVLVSSVDNTLSDTADQIWKNSRAEEVREFGGPSRIVIFLPRDLDFFRASGVVVQVLAAWRPRISDAAARSSNLSGYGEAIDPEALNREQQRYANGDNTLNSLYTTVHVNSSDWRVKTLPYDIRGWRVVIQAATSFEAVNQASQGLLVIIMSAPASRWSARWCSAVADERARSSRLTTSPAPPRRSPPPTTSRRAWNGTVRWTNWGARLGLQRRDGAAGASVQRPAALRRRRVARTAHAADGD